MSNSATPKPCFFVVDDNYADLQIFDAALDQIYPDSTRKCFEGGEDLFDFLENPLHQDFHASAIFLDYNMPEMNGKEVLHALQEKKCINSPVYILSGTIHKELERELISLGATGVYEKPADYYEILALFSKILNPAFVLK